MEWWWLGCASSHTRLRIHTPLGNFPLLFSLLITTSLFSSPSFVLFLVPNVIITQSNIYTGDNYPVPYSRSQIKRDPTLTALTHKSSQPQSRDEPSTQVKPLLNTKIDDKRERNAKHTQTKHRHTLSLTPSLAVQNDIQQSILKGTIRRKNACRSHDRPDGIDSRGTKVITRS